jgi:hypothetical protein
MSLPETPLQSLRVEGYAIVSVDHTIADRNGACRMLFGLMPTRDFSQQASMWRVPWLTGAIRMSNNPIRKGGAG